MEEPIPNNNEFKAAEHALRKIGSNLWFSALSDEWKDYLISNTLEHFDTYEISIHEAAKSMIGVYREVVSRNPELLEQNPWQAMITNK